MDGKKLAQYLEGSPYLIGVDRALQEAAEEIANLEERVSGLRERGTLSEVALTRYFGVKRYEQVAESNAIEGSTLDAGETEMAVLKGTTLNEHEEVFVRDALALNEALSTLQELAKDKNRATDIEQARQMHEQLMVGRPSAGLFRQTPVVIGGAEYQPPTTMQEIMDGMEAWQEWSQSSRKAPAVLRATVLHAWLAHIHPYVDGNGRTARAVSTLEFVRAGYPAAIIPRQRRNEYLATLAESDRGGEIRPFLELMLDLAGNALTGLEQSGKPAQELDYVAEFDRGRRQQEGYLRNLPELLRQGVYLLLEAIEHHLNKLMAAYKIRTFVKIFKYDWPLDTDKYLALRANKPATQTSCFNLSIQFPDSDLKDEVRMAYFGFRNKRLRDQRNGEGGISLFWSNRDWDSFRTWKKDDNNAPYCVEMSMESAKGDLWYVMPKRNMRGSKYSKLSTSELAERIAKDLAEMAIKRASRR